ncbi:MAG: DNA-directed DNA polymerase [Candidatus Nanoarchaeia archaeon]|nr:DNA-directed DNA polymerase [Candidatus Haiyanarchaeum thermophilum]MCW1306893.1 DNA-directed DNA polymerase [Candidatus Haiyanarchaeum thermophilum]MCW1308299.1 DNA-directed DNA polymerase [Candidatus Haiyanarchaeum thermophilum]MCW1309031.1 DNA-directed DNA polymerase [Candidatus Haiyanarchaeum thermophilum]
MKVSGILYHLELEDSKVILYLRSGERRIIAEAEMRPYFYVIDGKIEELKGFKAREKGRELRVMEWERVKRLVDGVEKEVWKVYCNHLDCAKLIERKFPTMNIRGARSDPLQVFLIEKGLEPLCRVEIFGEPVGERIRVKEIRKVGEGSLDELKILYFTLLVKSEDGFPIPEKQSISIICCLSDEMKCFSSDDDREAIRKFIEYFQEEDPDVIIGYAQDSEDFPYLLRRAKLQGIDLKLGVLGREIIETGKYFRGMIIKEVIIPGRANIDLFPIIYRDFPQLPTKRIGEVCEELGVGEFVDIPNYKLKELSSKDLEEYAKQKIMAIKKVAEKELGFQIELSKLCSLPISRVPRLTIGELVDALIFKEAMLRGWILPDRGAIEVEEGYYAGGEVWLKAPGIYENVGYYDIRSMYPSIIKLYNLSPEVFDCKCCSEKNLRELGIKHWTCSKRKGLLAQIVEELIEMRRKVKEEMKRAKGEEYEVLYAKQYVLRVIANAIYGYTGWSSSRLYKKDLAETITAIGRIYIKKIRELVEKLGFEAIYLDTDGIQVIPRRSPDFQGLLLKLNKEISLEVELKHVARRAIFFAKKKYCHLVDGKLEAKGLELVRRDYPKFIKEVQKKAMEMLLSGKSYAEVKNYVDRARKLIEEHKLKKEELVLVEQLAKKIEMYERSSKIKVCAEWLKKEKGIELHRGMSVEIIIIKGTGPVNYRARPVQFFSEEDLDWEYYLGLFDQVMERSLAIAREEGLKRFFK